MHIIYVSSLNDSKDLYSTVIKEADKDVIS